MIELILIYPLIVSIILLYTKSPKFHSGACLSYAILHFALSWLLYCKPDLNIYFSVDNLNIVFLLLLSIVFLAVSIYNTGFIKHRKMDTKESKYYCCAILIFIFSITGAILSTNLALSWVFLEATTLTSAYLIFFNKTKHAIEAAWKYVFICSIGIALAYVGIILLTISTGHLDSLFYSDLYAHAALLNPFWLKLSFVFMLVGVGTKMGLAPVHFWLPDAHAEAPAPVSALLSAALLNSAFLIILRVFKLVTLAGCDHYAAMLMLLMGLLSLFVAAVFIYKINNYKRMLAYSSIENMGIIIIAAALGGAGLWIALLHMAGHSIIKTAAFLTSGNILKIFKSKKVSDVSGIVKVDKQTGRLWVLCFCAIVALPLSPLFISEFLLIKTLISKEHFVIVPLFLLLLTIILYGMAKVVINMSFGKEKTVVKPKMYPSLYASQIILIILTLIFGVYIPPFVSTLLTNAMGG